VAGESFEIAGLQLQVLEAQRRRVSRVRVRKQPQPAEQGTS
jgi:CBS domain containing-hemolysin-like protein